MSEERLNHYKEWIEDNEEIVVDSSIFEELVIEIERLNNEIERLYSIIKEVREFIYKCNDGKQGINYSGCSKLLEILDKEK